MNKAFKQVILICGLIFILSSCHMSVKKSADINLNSYEKKELQHAKGFEIYTSGNEKVLRIYNKKNVDSTYQEFKLVKKKTATDQIQVPCKTIICLSSTQLTYFFALNDIDHIVATNSSRHLFH